jgi:hypothetical protein
MQFNSLLTISSRCVLYWRELQTIDCTAQTAGAGDVNRDWISFDDTRLAASISRGGAAVGGDAQTACLKCSYAYRLGWRLPNSLCELARVTVSSSSSTTAYRVTHEHSMLLCS